MREAAWSLGIVVVLLTVGLVQALGPESLVLLGEAVMVRAAAVALPLELVYFGALATALRGSGGAPRGWYWRSFEHHHRLGRVARRWVLPWFYLGTLAMVVIVLGVALVALAALGVLVRGRVG